MSEDLAYPAPPPGVEPLFLADHPALDMLNTVAVANGDLVDFWQTDDDVMEWLVKTGLAAHQSRAHGRAGALAESARSLREIVRHLVQRKKARSGPLPTELLNLFLAKGASHLELLAPTARKLTVHRVYTQGTPEAFLAPLAESAALLLAEGDFELVRHCEGQGCVLWFYDRTKAHRRRWCSMSICGNRAKVAAFRQRQS